MSEIIYRKNGGDDRTDEEIAERIVEEAPNEIVDEFGLRYEEGNDELPNDEIVADNGKFYCGIPIHKITRIRKHPNDVSLAFMLNDELVLALYRTGSVHQTIYNE